MADFPINALLPQIRTSLAQHPRLVLEAPAGAGKTTQVPLALLGADWLQGRRIVMLEPRRVATRAAAGFMAAQLGEAVGETVGYRIRFESRMSTRTRVEVVTEGILTRMLQDDPTLDGVGLLLFDEFHERHLAGDLGLAFALDIQASLRQDLRIVVMSATLDGARLAHWLDAPRLSSAGRSYPIGIAHFPAQRDESLEQQTRRAVAHALAMHPGDVLVFLPGRREISRVEQALGQLLPLLREQRVDVWALHGDLAVDEQSRLLQPGPQGRRRVVLATNVAESSVTLPGVRVVIDSGLAREPRYDPNSGFARLDVVAIAQASADQRAGRAGRVAEGWAYRLWPQSQRLEPQRRPEIAQVELAALALEIAAWGSDALRFLDPLPDGALAAARALLQRLGAVTPRTDAGARSHDITALGHRMLALGTHPRMAAMLLAPGDATAHALACDLAALLEARDPLRGRRSDAVHDRWTALAAWRADAAPADANRASLAAIDVAARQWRRRLRLDATPPTTAAAHLLGDLLAHAFPDRIARQHPADPRRYQLANGRVARLFDDSVLYAQRWIVATELRHEARDALLVRGAPVDEAQLQRSFPHQFLETDRVHWDPSRRALVAQRETRFDAIVLGTRPAGRVDPAQAARALTDAVRELGLQVLPWTASLSQWRARAMSLRAWLPEPARQMPALPDLSDSALLARLDEWLLPAFAGKARLEALQEDEFAAALQSLLQWSLRQRVDLLTPVRIRVASGMQRPISYAIDDHGNPASPILAVKLQELFGQADTPRIVEGRILLTLHLLSPAGRPLQVTQDLRGFWERTWPEVRKEMKGRYPIHPWPEDPWSATATHRAKPRAS